MELRDRLHSTVFDLTGNGGRVLHPEIQGVKNSPGDRERVIRYDMKDGKHVSELITALVVDPQRDAAEQAAADGSDAASDAENDEPNKDDEPKQPAWAKMLLKEAKAAGRSALPRHIMRRKRMREQGKWKVFAGHGKGWQVVGHGGLQIECCDSAEAGPCALGARKSKGKKGHKQKP